MPHFRSCNDTLGILAFKFSNNCMYMNEQFLIDNSSIENTTWSVMEKQNSPAEKVYSIKCVRSLTLATEFAMPQKRGKCSVLKLLY